MASRSLRAALLLALGAAGCATNPTSTLDAFAQRSADNSFEAFDRSVDPPDTLMLPVRHDQQLAGPSCGAHALASVVNYWRGAGAVSGEAIFLTTPPVQRDGYTMSELLTLAHANGLLASAVRLQQDGLIRELENGRPVLVPVRIPSIYLQDWTLPGANEPVVGLPAHVVASRVGWLSERTGLAMMNHYVVISGYEGDMFVALDPVMGFRTISFERLERYRAPFGDAALVFSAAARGGGQEAASAETGSGAS